jgi:hypothetical protein
MATQARFREYREFAKLAGPDSLITLIALQKQQTAT